MAQFFVLSLPRSRSFWCSRYLSYNGLFCSHDLVVGADSIAEFRKRLLFVDGTCETGVAMGWKLIKTAFPKARLAVVLRPVEEVLDSLARFNIRGNDLEADLRSRHALLSAAAAAPGVLGLTFESLGAAPARKALFEHCLQTPFDEDWDAALVKQNLQVDMDLRISELVESLPAQAALRAEVLASVARLGGGACLGLN